MSGIQTRRRNVLAELDLLAIAFINRCLPETKNRSVEEITGIFEKEAAGTGRSTSGPLTKGAATA